MNELRNRIIDGLIPVFNELGFKFIGGPANHFRRPVGEDVAEVYFNVFSSGRVYFSKVILSVKVVEEVVLSIGIPFMDLTTYLAYEDYLPTLQDQKEHSTDVFKRNPIENEGELEEFTSGLKLYMKERGTAFADYYHHLPNALKTMDALEKNGQHWHQLLGGGADHLFRGLIISKICADPGFEQKTRRADAIFYDASFQLADWIPRYEKLKERLLTLEPKYKYET